jgi:hypothetical protein
MPKFTYQTCCVEAKGSDIREMSDNAQEVTYATFARRCAGVQTWARVHGYDRYMPLSKDWHVSYYKGQYRAQPCYFLVWSGIEFIWLPRLQKKSPAHDWGYGTQRRFL